jgi:hypothetical protein
MAGTSVQSLL